MPEEFRPIINHVPTTEELRSSAQSGVVDPSLTAGASAPRTEEEIAASFTYLPSQYHLSLLKGYVSEVLGGASDDTLKRRALELLEVGTDEGREVGGSDIVSRDANDEVNIRERLASLSEHAPEAYEAISGANVIGFHGTRSVALAGLLLNRKLLSARRINSGEYGIKMVTGEHGAQSTMGQDGISFSHLGAIESAANYADAERSYKLSPEEARQRLADEAAEEEKWLGEDLYGKNSAAHAKAKAGRLRDMLRHISENPKSLEAVLLQNDFPVLIGVSYGFVDWAIDHPDNRVNHSRTIVGGDNNMGEFRPMASEIPLDALPVIAVPKDFIEGTQKLMDMFASGCRVVALDDIYRGPNSKRQGNYFGSFRRPYDQDESPK